MCWFLFTFHIYSHWLVEEGSNLRSYRSSTTLTVLPICPLSRLLSSSIRYYPYLWYPPCYISLQGLYYLAPFSMLVREMYPLHHVKELIVKSFSLWRCKYMEVIFDFQILEQLFFSREVRVTCHVTFALVFCLTMQRYELFLKYTSVFLFLTQF